VAQREYADAEPYLEHSLQARPDLCASSRPARRGVCENRPSKEALNELTQGLASDEDGSVHSSLPAYIRKPATRERRPRV